MLDDDKYQSKKEEEEGEDQGYKDDYKEPSKEEASMEDQEGRYPLSAINRLTLNMLKISKKYFDITETCYKFFERQWEERGNVINEAAKAYHHKMCRIIEMFETKYNLMQVVGQAYLVKSPVTSLQKTVGYNFYDVAQNKLKIQI